ncbi:MAG: aldehyde dehydrogenase family protein, partial [Phycisphaerales bacterium]|nr:aldehyde dehydrogenase family protein [Phycisphaerales bacterium]
MAFAHFINGRPIQSGGGPCLENLDPASGERLGDVPLESLREADDAVEAARQAFPEWAATPVGDRCQHLFRFKQILEREFEPLAEMIVTEHGKTLAEARGDVRRGIDCVEFACGAPTLMMGRSLPQIARSSSFCRTEDEGGVGLDSAADRVPLGVCVGITPFNFPIMVPLWMWPMAVACGNTFVLKPSEKVSRCAAREIELAHEAGFPPGVLNMVSGGPAVVDRLLEHPDVKAVSFVGSTRVARHIYATAAAHGKRAQCMAGAKNHMVIMPDANRAAAVDGVIGSAFGNTGQRCLAGSVAVLVGAAAEWFVPALLDAARAIRVDRGDVPGCGMGPLIDDAARQRVLAAIVAGIEDGATLLL